MIVNPVEEGFKRAYQTQKQNEREYSFLLSRRLHWSHGKPASFSTEKEQVLDVNIPTSYRDLHHLVKLEREKTAKQGKATLNKDTKKLNLSPEKRKKSTSSLLSTPKTRTTNMGVGFIGPGVLWPDDTSKEKLAYQLQLAEQRKIQLLRELANDQHARQQNERRAAAAAAEREAMERERKEFKRMKASLVMKEAEIKFLEEKLHEVKARPLSPSPKKTTKLVAPETRKIEDGKARNSAIIHGKAPNSKENADFGSPPTRMRRSRQQNASNGLQSADVVSRSPKQEKTRRMESPMESITTIKSAKKKKAKKKRKKATVAGVIETRETKEFPLKEGLVEIQENHTIETNVGDYLANHLRDSHDMNFNRQYSHHRYPIYSNLTYGSRDRLANGDTSIFQEASSKSKSRLESRDIRRSRNNEDDEQEIEWTPRTFLGGNQLPFDMYHYGTSLSAFPSPDDREMAGDLSSQTDFQKYSHQKESFKDSAKHTSLRPKQSDDPALPVSCRSERSIKTRDQQMPSRVRDGEDSVSFSSDGVRSAASTPPMILVTNSKRKTSQKPLIDSSLNSMESKSEVISRPRAKEEEFHSILSAESSMPHDISYQIDKVGEAIQFLEARIAHAIGEHELDDESKSSESVNSIGDTPNFPHVSIVGGEQARVRPNTGVVIYHNNAEENENEKLFANSQRQRLQEILQEVFETGSQNESEDSDDERLPKPDSVSESLVPVVSRQESESYKEKFSQRYGKSAIANDDSEDSASDSSRSSTSDDIDEINHLLKQKLQGSTLVDREMLRRLILTPGKSDVRSSLQSSISSLNEAFLQGSIDEATQSDMIVEDLDSGNDDA